MIESDLDLLHRYSLEGSEAAFEEVVRRHVDLVFSVAIRKVGSQHLAEEVVQSAFLDLAKSIQRLRSDTVVSAWLYQVAHRTAVDAVRRETRRATREQMAVQMNVLDSSSDPTRTDWVQVEPLLDDEVATLRPSAGAVPAYPTSRHVTAALGRLLRKNVLLQEALKEKRFEELSVEEQEALKNGGVAILREVATLTEAELQLNQNAQEPTDPIDEITVYAYGALDLNEEQFRKVYALVRELQGEAAGLVAGDRSPSEDERAALKARGGQRLKAMLNGEQERLFQLLESHLPLVRFQPVP
jgi:RNA polymerase sigma factor (sigma-70 family)